MITVFNIDNNPMCMETIQVACIADWRADRCNVVFKKKVNNETKI